MPPKAKNCKRPGLKVDPKFIPVDVLKLIKRYQGRMMDDCGCKIAQTEAIYAMIREAGEIKIDDRL